MLTKKRKYFRSGQSLIPPPHPQRIVFIFLLSLANRKRFQLKVAEEVVDFEGLFLTGRPSREMM
jgi:hypothetical protein